MYLLQKLPLPETTRNISVNVTDGTNAVSDASVVIDDITRTTGSQGGCTFNDITDGEHTVTVTKTGYVTKTETITVSEDNTTFTITVTSE
jgi:hypothetical protein